MLLRRPAPMAGLGIATLVALLSSLHGASAITCSSAVQKAVAAIPSSTSGIEWPCCSRSTASCKVVENDCPSDFPDFATCFRAGGAVSCQITETTDSGAPCGGYSGTVGSPGVTPVGGNAFKFSGLESLVRASWTGLAVDNSVVACCSASSGSCHTSETERDLVNPCKSGEYELLCAGSSQHGICSVYANSTRTRPLGSYFLINLEAKETDPTSSSDSSPPAADPTSSSSGDSDTSTATTSKPSDGSASTPSTSPSASPKPSDLTGTDSHPDSGSPSDSKSTPGSTDSTAANADPSGTADGAAAGVDDGDDGGPNPLTIALPVVVVALLLGLGAFFFLRRRRRNQQAAAAAATPYTSFAPGSSDYGSPSMAAAPSMVSGPSSAMVTHGSSTVPTGFYPESHAPSGTYNVFDTPSSPSTYSPAVVSRKGDLPGPHHGRALSPAPPYSTE